MNTICICGSTRFMREIHRAETTELVAGRIVLRAQVHPGDLDPRLSITDPAAIRARLSELQHTLIALADAVLFIAPGGYMGEATRAELAYALGLGKGIRIDTTNHPPAPTPVLSFGPELDGTPEGGEQS